MSTCPLTFVGDRGMIKSIQIKEMPEGLHYITAITKPQIQSLIKKGQIQLELFDTDVFEVEFDGVRYVLRRNPIRADEVMQKRLDKQHSIERLVDQKNLYLRDHSRAKVPTAIKHIIDKIKRIKLDKWLQVQDDGRMLSLQLPRRNYYHIVSGYGID